MSGGVYDELRTQGRGVAGALLVLGLSMLFTMETWWLSWQLPIGHLAVISGLGLAAVFGLAREVGFRERTIERETPPVRLVSDFAELVVQSFVAAYVALLALGVVRLGDSPAAIVRIGLVQVVPFGFGAALANLLLTEPDPEIEQETFPGNLAVFALGAVFFGVPLVATDEIAALASAAGWTRLAALVVLSVGVVHLVLHELEFRGHNDRVEGRTHATQLGTAAMAYAVGVAVVTLLLFAVGQFDGRPVREGVQLVLVASFPAATGASAGEVVL